MSILQLIADAGAKKALVRLDRAFGRIGDPAALVSV
jgi:hypothetical protein